MSALAAAAQMEETMAARLPLRLRDEEGTGWGHQEVRNAVARRMTTAMENGSNGGRSRQRWWRRARKADLGNE